MTTGCKQGAPESPHLWSSRLDEVVAPVFRKWQQEGRGYNLLALVVGAGERRPRTSADAAPKCNHLGDADDLIQVAACPRDIQDMFRDAERASPPGSGLNRTNFSYGTTSFGSRSAWEAKA